LILPVDTTAEIPNNFTWSGPGDPDLNVNDSIQNNSNLDPGLYKVVVTDVNGWCTDSAEFNLIQPSEIQFWIDSVYTLNGWNVTCAESADGYLGIGSGGGILSHDYEWKKDGILLPGMDTPVLEFLAGGTYDLTITDSIGCTLDTSIIMREPNPLTVQDSIPHYNFYEVACAGDSTGEVYLTPYGGADSSQNVYLWSTIDGIVIDPDSMNQFGISAGTYSVMVTDINGCTYDTMYVLEDPLPLVVDSLSADSARCFGTATGFVYLEASGGVGEFGYLWNSGQTTEDLQNIYAGTYVVTISDANACVLTDSIEVFEADHFSVDLLVDSDYHGVPVSCADSSDAALSLNPVGGTEPYFYQWNTGDTTNNLVGIPAGAYKVIVKDIWECTDSAEVVIIEPEALDYSIQVEDPLCYNDSTGQIQLLLTGGTVFTLEDYRVTANGIVRSPYMDNLPEGFYSIRIEDLNDCFIETEAELINPDSLVLSFDTENAFCKDKQDGQLNLYVDGGIFPYLIGWDRGLSDNESSFNDVFWGDYVATVTDANNCVTIDSVYVDFTYASCLVIPNAFSPNSDGYNDLWIIEGLELYPNAEIRIFDRWGTSVYYSPAAGDNPWDGSFSGRELPIDSYHYIIDLNNDEPPITGNITIVR